MDLRRRHETQTGDMGDGIEHAWQKELNTSVTFLDAKRSLDMVGHEMLELWTTDVGIEWMCRENGHHDLTQTNVALIPEWNVRLNKDTILPLVSTEELPAGKNIKPFQ